jgi:flagellar hook-associated protein 1 FlgK
MGSLLTTLLNSANALGVFSQEFNVIQNNITNASSPGYAKQTLPLEARPFDPSTGLTGGVLAAPILTARSLYLEQAVRNQQQFLGSAQQTSTDLGVVQPLFDLTTAANVPSNLNTFFNGFSRLAVAPNDASARQNVIALAGQVAQSFNQDAAGITQVQANANSQTRDAVAAINGLAGQITTINQEFRSGTQASHDAGLDAQLTAALENLSQVANFTVIKSPDGTLNVYLGGQTPLVIGDRQFPISADFAASQTAVRDAQGKDITSQITQGSLGGLLVEHNTTLPGYLTDLNTLAQSFADSVNAALAQGVDQNGLPPATNLFTYNAVTGAASTLAVTGITSDQIAAALPSAPGGNGNAIALAQLGSKAISSGFTATQLYGNLAARVGRDVANAQQETTRYQDSVTQAQQQRSTQTGVSLNEEATKLLQFQQAYQAAGKLITVLDTLTQTLLNILPGTG